MQSPVLATTVAVLLLFCATAANSGDATVAKLQEILNERQCSAGAVDGKWGKKTAAALANLANEAGLPPEIPPTVAFVEKLAATSAKCKAPSLAGLSPVEAAAKLDGSLLKGWSAEQMRTNAARNKQYCELGSWDTNWLGDPNDIDLQKNLVMIGDDLAMYRSNTNGYVTKLHRLTASAAVNNDVAPVKEWLLEGARNRHFTKLTPYRPKSWEGTKPSWIAWYGSAIPEAEPAFYGSILLLQLSVPYAMVQGSLTEEEDTTIRAWGRAIYAVVSGAKKTLMQTEAKRRDAPDIRAAYAAAFTAWGAQTGDIEIFRKGAMLFQEAMGRIRGDGTEMFFANGTKPGLELKYQNFTYGGLAMAAHTLYRNGIGAYDYKPKGGVSLAETLAMHLEATYDPVKRKRIQKQQHTLYFDQTRSHGDQTLAYLELVAADGVLDGNPLMAEALDRRDRGRVAGYYGGYHGGYTTCLFGEIE